MWYLIQTEEGKEQELIDALRGSTEEETRQIGEYCFLLRRETVWRREGRCIPHVETLFPGCVFAEEDGKEDFSERLERALRNLKTAGNTERNAEENERLGGAVSDLSGAHTHAAAAGDSAVTADAMSEISVSASDARLRGDVFAGSSTGRIHPVREEDRMILEQLLDGDRERIVRLSPVEVDEEDEEKRIIGCGGALRHYQKDIVKKRIRLRYVVVRLPFLGGLRDVLLGIRLKGDEGAPEEATAGMA